MQHLLSSSLRQSFYVPNTNPSPLPHCEHLPLASAQLGVFVFGSEWVRVGGWSVASTISESNNGAEDSMTPNSN